MDKPVSVGLIGAGRIGAFHGERLAKQISGTRLVMVADPAPSAATKLANRIGCKATTQPEELINNPEIDAVVIAAPPQFHTNLVVAAASAGKAIFCEKPMALTLADADRAILIAAHMGVPLQVGFNRRFDASFTAAHLAVTEGRIGTPHLLRSLTRDPAGFDPAKVPPWMLHLETLVHDFDILRYLNPGAEAIDVYAVADALARPDWKSRGLLDTSMVMIRFDNGAIAMAEASFSAAYGYDVRSEVFGSSGMISAGGLSNSSMVQYSNAGMTIGTWRRDVDLFRDAYVAELNAFSVCVRNKTAPPVTGQDARAALAIAHAAIRSIQTGTRVQLSEIEEAVQV